MKSIRSSPSLQDSDIIPLMWRDEHEDILRKWKARCFVNLWLCVASAYFYAIMHNWLTYPVIIMSAVSSAALFSYDSTIVKYVLGLITLSCGIITSTTRHLRPGEMYQSHSSFAKKYLNLIRTIDTCLSLTTPMRPAPDIFLERVGNELDMFESSQLDPPMFIVKRFEKKYGAMHRILYGDDIIELMKIELQAHRLYNKIRTSTLANYRLSDVSLSDIRPTQLPIFRLSETQESTRRFPSIDETMNSRRLPSIDESRTLSNDTSNK